MDFLTRERERWWQLELRRLRAANAHRPAARSNQPGRNTPVKTSHVASDKIQIISSTL